MNKHKQGIPYSLLARRRFLVRTGAVLVAVFFGQVLLPLWRYLFPGQSREPDMVAFSDELLAQLVALEPGECLRFAWGGFPGLILRPRSGEFRTFKGVCSHADCNVSWRSTENDFFCACHDGRYDEFGKNVAGPPPRPLSKLFLQLERDQQRRIIKAAVWRSESVWRKQSENA